MRKSARGEAGFTLPEVMVAALVLVISVVGTATLADVGNTMTKRADSRSAATSIARNLSEAARSLTSTQLSTSNLLDALKTAAPNLTDSTPGDAAWTIEHRGGTYVVSASVCTVDDATDGFAAPSARDASYCAQPAATTPADNQPDDYRRVRVSVYNQRFETDAVRQFTAVSSGSTTSLPLITDLKMRQGTGTCATSCLPITSQTQTSAIFDATTVNNPATLNWQIDGRTNTSCPPITAVCTGSGNSWSFTWNIGTVQKDTSTSSVNYGQCVAGNYTLDGVYRVGLQTADRNNASGGATSLSTSVNRCAPLAPRGFNATGRNANGAVDVEWQENSEGDIVGYRVYRGTSTTQRTQVCPPSIASGQVIPIDAANECVDTAAPAYSTSPLYYGVYAVDRDANGNLREGAVSYQNVNTGNRAPAAPASFAGTKDGGGRITLTWSVPNAQDPDNGDRIASFRVYRRAGSNTTGPAIANRYDYELIGALCTNGTCRWTDPTPVGTTQAYWVTSVDTRLRESAFTTGRAL